MKKVFLQFNKAFTLAEVLITLVIIGVIAALTIPTAINNTKEQELKSQFAKAYSTILQTIRKTETNNYFGYVECYYNDDESGYKSAQCISFYNAAFSKNVQVQKVCQNNSLANGCIPEYKTYSTGSSHELYTKNSIENNNRSYVLANGIIIIPYSTTWSMPLFLVDINGHKGPNAYGKDLFSFIIRRSYDKGLYIAPGGGINPVSGGKTTEEMIKYALSGIE